MCLAIPGCIVELAADPLGPAKVRFGEVLRPVCLACVPEAQIGDYVIVHAGFAISLLDSAEAERTLALLDAARDARGGET
ncbi:MAG: HypC/HybG/HupF family hydrogenase formation chaperone [Polyangiaceae bacterium]